MYFSLYQKMIVKECEKFKTKLNQYYDFEGNLLYLYFGPKIFCRTSIFSKILLNKDFLKISNLGHNFLQIPL